MEGALTWLCKATAVFESLTDCMSVFELCDVSEAKLSFSSIFDLLLGLFAASAF